MGKWIVMVKCFAAKLVGQMMSGEPTDDTWGEIVSWSVSNSPRRGHGGGGGGSGAGMITALFVALILIFVGLYFVATFVPVLTNIPETDGIVGTFLDIAIWVVPLLAIVGLIIYGIRRFTGGRG